VLAETRTWIGTPYQHQCSLKGAGADCLGLVRGVWRMLYGEEPMAIPPYSPDWAEKNGQETLLMAARTCLTEISPKDTIAGDVLLFRMAPNAPCKHMAVLSTPNQIIHAYWGRAVVESVLIPYWRKRIAFAFSFPDHIEV